ncbi:MAG: hypothetical protein JNM96_04840 [Bacteroidia bacterium]|nr:hypothetical protein [Bacteroidia bacterium]
MMLVSLFGSAQKAKVYRAQSLLNEKKANEARLCIDSALTDAEARKMPEAFTIRAFAYYEIYKTTDKLKLNSTLRDTIINSIRISNSLNPDEDFKSNNNKLMVSLAGNYYNIAKTLLQDSINYESSVIAFNKFKDIMKNADPNFNVVEKDKEYYLAVGSIYSQRFNENNKDTKANEIAKIALLKVLEIQPDDPSANMNLGLMYLNTSATMVQNMDDIVELKELDVIIDNYIKLAKQAEQFILKVYEKNNKNPKSVEALYYVYKILNENAKIDEFRNKCKELNIPISDN